LLVVEAEEAVGRWREAGRGIQYLESRIQYQAGEGWVGEPCILNPEPPIPYLGGRAVC
jgi:hypothetical protein